MRRITKTDTRPELSVRRLLHSMGYRFRLYAPEIPGRPDIVFRPRRKVIFVHGCFWHQHRGRRLARRPKSRPDYWPAKLDRNVERDAQVRQRMAETGWEVLVVWECETADQVALRERLAEFLT